MPVGARQLTLLGEFRPFGLVAEALNGKPPDDSHDKYHYFLFDSDVVREGDEKDDNNTSGSSLSHFSDHDLFIRGNRFGIRSFAQQLVQWWSRFPMVLLLSTTSVSSLKAELMFDALAASSLQSFPNGFCFTSLRRDKN